jgi:hypothetical protein
MFLSWGNEAVGKKGATKDKDQFRSQWVKA